LSPVLEEDDDDAVDNFEGALICFDGSPEN
jgi:hypothetical protein